MQAMGTHHTANTCKIAYTTKAREYGRQRQGRCDKIEEGCSRSRESWTRKPELELDADSPDTEQISSRTRDQPMFSREDRASLTASHRQC